MQIYIIIQTLDKFYQYFLHLIAIKKIYIVIYKFICVFILIIFIKLRILLY
jgi:hypothetical protein